jgi:hypothetical protein
MDDNGNRELVIAVAANDASGAEVGDRFPVLDHDEKFS